MTTRRIVILVLFGVAVFAFLGAWLISLTSDHSFLGSENFNAWLAAGGFFATLALFVERID